MFKTNEYFDGKVKSIAFESGTTPATVGVMAPGQYEFGTSSTERMTVVSGELKIRMPGGTDWTSYPAGTTFDVPSGVTFGVEVPVTTSYLCLYGI